MLRIFLQPYNYFIFWKHTITWFSLNWRLLPFVTVLLNYSLELRFVVPIYLIFKRFIRDFQFLSETKNYWIQGKSILMVCLRPGDSRCTWPKRILKIIYRGNRKTQLPFMRVRRSSALPGRESSLQILSNLPETGHAHESWMARQH